MTKGQLGQSNLDEVGNDDDDNGDDDNEVVVGESSPGTSGSAAEALCQADQAPCSAFSYPDHHIVKSSLL